jgi:hypothetical protein
MRQWKQVSNKPDDTANLIPEQKILNKIQSQQLEMKVPDANEFI